MDNFTGLGALLQLPEFIPGIFLLLIGIIGYLFFYFLTVGLTSLYCRKKTYYSIKHIALSVITGCAGSVIIIFATYLIYGDSLIDYFLNSREPLQPEREAKVFFWLLLLVLFFKSDISESMVVDSIFIISFGSTLLFFLKRKNTFVRFVFYAVAIFWGGVLGALLNLFIVSYQIQCLFPFPLPLL